MAQLYSKVKFYLEDKGKDIKVEFQNFTLRNDNDGNGSFIDVWNVEGVDKPTDEQLTAFETQADDWEANTPNSADLKASAKAKLIAGEPLTEEEADTIVL
tara:strand:- start:51 stop:350 length:300 start_codon:yes stop_codon:yes gene_type:complete